MSIQIKRAYTPWDKADGYRVLVDRIWPRGLTKEALKIDLWLKAAAPSTALRKWFGHDAVRFDEFDLRYRDELNAAEPSLKILRDHARQGRVTLVYGARDEVHNHAVVLRDVLLEH